MSDHLNFLERQGEPTSEMIAFTALSELRHKRSKNEIRDFGDWRQSSEGDAIQHKAGVHD